MAREVDAEDFHGVVMAEGEAVECDSLVIQATQTTRTAANTRSNVKGTPQFFLLEQVTGI